MDQIKSQVVVIGAGPAGVAAAYVFGKNSVNTILVDKKPQDKIGDKTCGDALDTIYCKEAFRLSGLPEPQNNGDEIKEICKRSIFYGETQDNYIDLTSSSVTVDRLTYGQSLLEAASTFETVTLYANTRLRDVIIDNDQIVGCTLIRRTDEGIHPISVSTDIILDCSGSSGVVRKKLPVSMCTKFPKQLPKHQMIVAYREIIRLKTDHQYRNGLFLTYEPEVPMPGYYWIFSRGACELNIGLGWLQTPENRHIKIKYLHEKIRNRKFPEADIIKANGDQIPARLPLPSLVHNGFMTAGDAAALANPINGEGHGPALVAGVKAAQVATVALQERNVSEERLWEYNKWIWKRFGSEFSYGIPVVKFVNKFGFSALDWVLRKGVLKSNDITTMVRDPNADLGILKRVVRGISKPRLLLGLRSVFDQAKEIQSLSVNYPDFENFEDWNKKLQKIEIKPL